VAERYATLDNNVHNHGSVAVELITLLRINNGLLIVLELRVANRDVDIGHPQITHALCYLDRPVEVPDRLFILTPLEVDSRNPEEHQFVVRVQFHVPQINLQRLLHTPDLLVSLIQAAQVLQGLQVVRVELQTSLVVLD